MPVMIGSQDVYRKVGRLRNRCPNDVATLVSQVADFLQASSPKFLGSTGYLMGVSANPQASSCNAQRAAGLRTTTRSIVQ